MMNNLLLHPKTKLEIEELLARPRHAVLIKGIEGSGKYYTARIIASTLLTVDSNKLQTYAYYYEFQPVKNVITIENIRSLISKAQLRTTGSKVIRRIMLIKDADYMTIEAQNALLKLLEEPPRDTVILLTTSRSSALLPTIHSRVTTLHIKPLEKQVLQQYFNTLNIKEFTAHYHLSDGGIGMMCGLINGDHNSNDSIELAKKALTESPLGQLAMVEEITKKSTEGFIDALIIIARAGLKTAKNTTQAKRWSHILTSACRAQASIDKRGHSKLVLTHLIAEL